MNRNDVITEPNKLVRLELINENVCFIKGHMCSPAIATQEEDLIAGGAFNNTAVARLYGFDYEIINSTKILTDELEGKLLCKNLHYKRGVHWTTDAGYRETWGQIIGHREKGALCH